MSNEILIPEVLQAGDHSDYQPLNPCPSCGAEPHPDMKRAYQEEHCFRCGWRPGTASVSHEELTKAFRTLLRANREALGEHPSLSPPDPSEVDALRAQIADMEAQLAARNTPAQGIGSNQAFNPPGFTPEPGKAPEGGSR